MLLIRSFEIITYGYKLVSINMLSHKTFCVLYFPKCKMTTLQRDFYHRYGVDVLTAHSIC